MSFDANIGRAQPMIKAATSMNNDGGSGGNAGYMMRGKKKNQAGGKHSLFENPLEVDYFDGINDIPTDGLDNYNGTWFDKFVNKFIK